MRRRSRSHSGHYKKVQRRDLTYTQLRCAQKVIFRQFVLARDLVVLAVERCTVIYGIWRKENICHFKQFIVFNYYNFIDVSE